MKTARLPIAALLLTAMLASCGSTGTKADTTAAGTDSTTPEETTVDIYADLPEGDFGGREFVFANETESKWAILMLDAEDLNGELINDAVYNRNRLVEDRLNVKIRCESNPNSYQLKSALVSNVMAGDDPYDVYDINSNLSSALILEDYFHEIDALKVDLSKPWWNENVMESLTFAGKTYSLASDASIMMWEASLCFMFNKTMSADLKLDDHYELVRSGKWTFDAAAKTMKLAARDLNGNTERETEDAWGLTANLRLMSYLLISGGETIVGTDKDGLPTFDGLTPAMTDKFEKIYNVFFDSDDVFISARGQVWKEAGKGWHNVFTDGTALYFFEPIGSSMELRDAKFDWGFLPLPKYNEAQEEYITPIIHFTHVMHVSKCRENTEMIGTVLTHLAAESKKTVRPAYFDHIIEGKRVQDDDTIEMFDIIFGNQVMNPACIYDWGGVCGTLNNAGQNRQPEIASQMAAALPGIKAAIQDTIDFYSK